MTERGSDSDSATDDSLDETLRRQIAAVDRRVSLGGGVYSEETGEIREAARWTKALRAELGLGPLVESLTPDTGKPQVLFAFETAVHGPVVLKVYGTARPGEAASQRLWVARGVRSVPVLASGDAPVSWLLMERIPAAALHGADPAGADPAGIAGQRSLTREVAAVMRHAHDRGDAGLSVAHALVPSWLRHLTIAVGVLRRHGYRVPDAWDEVTARAGASDEPVLLHADLTPGNLIRDQRDGRLRIFDASGTVGPAAFDAARWAARTGGADGAERLLHDWLAVEDSIGQAQAFALLGVELLMQAGVVELMKAERGLPADRPDEETIGCLNRSAKLLKESGY